MPQAQRQTAPTRCTRESGNGRSEVFSEQYPHGKIHLIGDAGTVIDGKRVQTSELSGEQQVRSRPVNQIAKRAAITSQNVAEVVSVRGKAPDITGERVILGENAIDFKFGSQLELELAPSPSGV